MLIVTLDEACPGMKLAVTVTHPEHPDQDLLRAGFDLRAEIIGRLREMGIEQIYVDYPGLEDLDRHMAANLSPARQQVYAQIRDTIAAVQKTAQPTVTFPDYYASTRELVLTLMQQGQNAIYIDQLSGKLGASAVAHATAVAHLSLMLGIRLEQYLIRQRARLSPEHAREVINLGVAGMLHDVGTAGLPPELRKFSRIAIPEELEHLDEWATHPQRGYDMIKGGVEATAAAAVLHHHQHYDGSGFPTSPAKPGEEPRNAGQRIHVFARILAIADLYDRLTLGAEGQRRPNIEILHLMRTRYADWLDPEIMKIVPSMIPPFPPGVRVTLTDGTDAVTVGLRPDRPYHPLVKRIESRDPFTLSATTIDLTLEKGLEIDKVAGVSAREMIPPPPPAPAAARKTAQAGNSLASASA
ncbi:MAG: phosphohydrolase [Phycisphaerales bacterium]|nr:phosphohydrolase [Phycisphaerales bacterium]